MCERTRKNVGSIIVRCIAIPFASLVAGDFLINVCSHCFVYLLFSIAKVVTIFEYPNKFLLFIENLCFCSLKIAVCALKIPTGRKRIKIPIRLKITEWSKNYGLKIPVRVCMCTRVCACV